MVQLNEKVNIQIPIKLFEKIKDKIKGTSFSSVEDYVVMKLENEFPTEQGYSIEEERIIRERLRRLGYIE
jgi:hypothetical protein